MAGEIRKILALLGSEAHERQIAAAIVLGEIGARDAAVLDALVVAVGRGIPPVQRDALYRVIREYPRREEPALPAQPAAVTAPTPATL